MVEINVTVTDGGIPALFDTSVVHLYVLNGSLVCTAPPVYLSIGALPNGQTILGTVQCSGVADGSLTFTEDPSQDLLAVNSQGDLFLGSQVQSLSSGTYTVQVMAHQPPFPSVSVDVSIIIGNFTPECFPSPNLALMISEENIVNTCYELYQCRSPMFGGTMDCAISSTDTLVSFFELDCTAMSTNFNYYVVNVSICVHTSIAQQNQLGTHQVHGEVSNNFGTTTSTFEVDILPGNFFAPVFSTVNYVVQISEMTANGTSLFQLMATDNDVNDVLTFSIPDQSLPFIILGDNLLVDGKLNATSRNSYSFQVKVSDLVGHEAFAPVSITLTDVNEPPICVAPYFFVVDATATGGQTVAQLSCYDTDEQNNFRTFMYLLDPFESSSISALVMVSSDGQITLLQDMSGDVESYTFTALARDLGGLNTSIQVTMIVNRYFAPICPLGFVETKIMDDFGPSQCFSVNTGCTDPLSGNLYYNIIGGSGSQLFLVQPDLSGLSVSTLTLCPQAMLTNQLGSWQVNVEVRNQFNQTSVLVNVIVEEKNDRPVFAGPVYVAAISEKIPVGHIFLQTTAQDADILAINNELTFSLDLGDVNGFAITSDTGMISTTRTFNASIQTTYQFSAKVEDPQGLSDERTVVVDILDENDPPQCENLVVNVAASLITSPGTIIGAVNCWDSDIQPDNKKLVYILSGPLESYLVVRDNGSIELSQSLPRSSTTTYSMTLKVYDQFMINNNTQAGHLTIALAVLVDTSIPPVCDRIITTATLQETDPQGTCVGQEVICEDPTGGSVTILSSQGTGLDVAEIKSRASSSNSILPLNVCTSSSIKNRIQDFRVSVVVSNGFGTQTVTWTFDVEDINEPPFFLNSVFNMTISESSIVGTTVLILETGDSDVDAVFKDVTVSYDVINVPDNVAVPISFLLDCCFLVTGKLNASEQDLYLFNVTLTDGGGLSQARIVSVWIADTNEAPVCSPATLTRSISLLAQVNDVIGQLSCYDYDKDLNYKELVYQSNVDYFNVSDQGELTISRSLDRFDPSYTVLVSVRDGGTPPLSTSVTITVNVDIAIKAVCQPEVQYPNVWVKDQCLTLTMNCVDPTLPGQTAHLSYTESGNYTAGFTKVQSPKGQYQLCYNLVQSGSFGMTVSVFNGLAYYMYHQPLDVKYDQSNPVFTRTTYNIGIPETHITGQLVTTVTATTASTSGSIVYSITGGTWSNVTNIFRLDASTGAITTRVSMRGYAAQTIILDIQALNDFSLLRSTARVEVSVTDINEVPSCFYQDEIIGNSVTVGVDDAVGTLLLHIQCTDYDVTPENKELSAVLTYTPSVLDVFMLEEQGGDYTIRTKNLLPVQTGSYDLTLVISDSATPPLSVQILRRVIVNLLPPTPVFNAFPINSTVVQVEWLYERADYYAVTTNFVLAAVSSSDRHSFMTPPDPSVTGSLITKLIPETGVPCRAYSHHKLRQCFLSLRYIGDASCTYPVQFYDVTAVARTTIPSNFA
ncbi:protocadherin Fat 3-like isoform X2 [Pecten maximus]|nr:protocadherin Fat 3-like isoform X2 [Pecten maximus]